VGRCARTALQRTREMLAQNNIGWIYAKGQSVPRDLSEARAWIQRAADVGYEEHRSPTFNGSPPSVADNRRTGCSALYALSSPYSSKAEINGQTTDKMAHQSATDDSTIIISAAHSGRTISRWS
jgi:hypothetical protein